MLFTEGLKKNIIRLMLDQKLQYDVLRNVPPEFY